MLLAGIRLNSKFAPSNRDTALRDLFAIMFQLASQQIAIMNSNKTDYLHASKNFPGKSKDFGCLFQHSVSSIGGQHTIIVSFFHTTDSTHNKDNGKAKNTTIRLHPFSICCKNIFIRAKGVHYSHYKDPNDKPMTTTEIRCKNCHSVHYLQLLNTSTGKTIHRRHKSAPCER